MTLENPIKKNERNPQEVFELLKNDLKKYFDTLEDSDIAYGRIFGVLKTVPTSKFEINFDVSKKDFDTFIMEALEKEFSDKEESDIISLKRTVDFASADQASLPPEERDRKNIGGESAIIY